MVYKGSVWRRLGLGCDKETKKPGLTVRWLFATALNILAQTLKKMTRNSEIIVFFPLLFNGLSFIRYNLVKVQMKIFLPINFSTKAYIIYTYTGFIYTYMVRSADE